MPFTQFATGPFKTKHWESLVHDVGAWHRLSVHEDGVQAHWESVLHAPYHVLLHSPPTHCVALGHWLSLVHEPPICCLHVPSWHVSPTAQGLLVQEEPRPLVVVELDLVSHNQISSPTSTSTITTSTIVMTIHTVALATP
jgi:hypothetical protein